MDGSWTQRLALAETDHSPAEPESFSAGDRRLRSAIGRTRQWLLDNQNPAGYWVGELEGDTILESEYILLLAHLGRHRGREAQRAARTIERAQRPQGGWAIYPGGPLEISASVKAYFALKLTGHDAAGEPMRTARAAILAHGGADAVNSFTRFYLALLGQISYEQCPAVPPEIVLLPRWCPVNLYALSAWTRTMVVPLSIMSARRPLTAIDPTLGIRELFIRSPAHWPEPRCPGLATREGPLTWDRFFRAVDRFWKGCQRRGVLPLRRQALAAAERWMLERFQGSDGLGAIFPPMVWSIIALRSLGHDDASEPLRYCYQRLAGLFIDEGDSLRLQPCKSPVWDTAIALRALVAAGLPRQRAIEQQVIERGAIEQEVVERPVERAVDWLLDAQIDRPGDWSHSVRAEPGGWCFEYANDFYPDVDDTAMAVMALADQFDDRDERLVGVGRPAPSAGLDAARLARASGAIAKAERWMLAMQNRDGGWGAFDRDNDRQYLCHVPFADHNAMIDPSTPDLTARVLEALGRLGRRLGDRAVDGAVAYLRRTQQADGSWFGRWGVNYVYGTWQVLTGLAAVGLPADDELMTSGAQWLLVHQQPEGAWGESPASYAQPHLRGQGPPTASQTAWGILGLLAAGLGRHEAAGRGVDYLLRRQRDDGTWDEPEFTGTGFPQVFYLRYHLYRIYFPLLALARFAAACGRP